MKKYGITKRKTLKLEFPNLPKGMEKYFLRGYFDGDGSIGIYDLGRSKDLLSIQLVGTESFMKKCQEIIPVKFNIYKIKRCKNLYTFNLTGKKAEAFGKWLWSDRKTPLWKKEEIFLDYLNNYNPDYRKYQNLKIEAKKLYDQGLNPVQIGKELNIAFQTIYKWKNKNFED